MSLSALPMGLGVEVRECFPLFLCWYTCCTVFSAFSCTHVGGSAANLLELRFLPEHQIVLLRVFNYCGGNVSEALFSGVPVYVRTVVRGLVFQLLPCRRKKASKHGAE